MGKGNPASSPEVEDMVQAVKTRDSAEGERCHSAAMSKEYMDRVMEWSTQECPVDILKHLQCSEAFAKVRAKVTKHLFMRAFCSSAWTVWTRYGLPTFAQKL